MLNSIGAPYPNNADDQCWAVEEQAYKSRRLSINHLDYIIQVMTQLADTNAVYERNLFIAAVFKYLPLEIAELSERRNWSPVMGHFERSSNNRWSLKTCGRAGKIRCVAIPDGFIPYLKRYRSHRALAPLPIVGEQHPIFNKLRGQGGLTSKQLRRIIQSIFDYSYQALCETQGLQQANQFQSATTRWLRGGSA